jgi:hypothetical protein
MGTRMQKQPQAEPFDLKVNAMEGIEEALYWHTAGVVTDLGNGLGTATTIRFRNHCFLLTANHVVENTFDKDLRFFFRPPGTLKRSDWWQKNPMVGRFEGAQAIDIFHRFRHPKADVAALVVSPVLPDQCNVRFFELGDVAQLPRPLSSVAAIGFPVDSRQHLGRATFVAAHPLWGNVERGRHWRPTDYRPRRNFLLRFLPATEGRHPGGYSGAGVWCHRSTPKPGLWSPNIALAGMITHYFPRQQFLLIERIETLLSFLRAIAPQR